MLILALILGTLTASANDAPAPPNRSPYQVNVGRDLAIAGSVGFLSGLPRVFADELLSVRCGLDCDPNRVPAFDRGTIGNQSYAASSISNMTYIGGMALPFALGAVDTAFSKPEDGWGGYGTDTVVMLQTLSVTLAFSNGVNFLVRRPRPYVYDPQYSDEWRTESAATLSFYSGHTTAVFSMATAYSRLFQLRHPRSPLVAPMWVFTYGLASTTGYLRVVTGYHFPSDVILGAVTGIGWGMFVPWTHQILRKQGRGLVSVGPMVLDGGAGALIRIR